MEVIDLLISAAAIWVLVKAVEILPIACHDIFVAVSSWNERRRAPLIVAEEPLVNLYDSRRGKLEYIISGAGFGDLRLIRHSKKWFLITTLVPLFMFTIELFSIYLGLERRICKTSSDPSVISAPSFVLFGNGAKIYYHCPESILPDFRFKTLEEEFGTPYGEPCVRRHSEDQRVDFSAKICGETASIAAHVTAAAPELAAPSNNKTSRDTAPLLNKHIATMISTELKDSNFFYIRVYEMKSLESKDDLLELGSIRFSSQVLVGGKNVLVRNMTSKGRLSSEQKQQFRYDLEEFDELYRAVNNVSDSHGLKRRPVYWENDDMFGFRWNLESYMTRGGLLMAYALLFQATVDSRRKATEMSQINNIERQGSRRLHDTPTFCVNVPVIFSRTVSIGVIIGGVLLQWLLSFVPHSTSSVEFALATSEEIANSQECSVFFMDRRRATCTLKHSNNRIFNHAGYISVGMTGTHPKLPWR